MMHTLKIQGQSSGVVLLINIGYLNQENVIFDEFRGSIDIAHLLRWTDKYPVRVEVKGGSIPLAASKLYFTSNLHPRGWYPELDYETYEALERRLTIIEVTERDEEDNTEVSE